MVDAEFIDIVQSFLLHDILPFILDGGLLYGSRSLFLIFFSGNGLPDLLLYGFGG